MNDLTLDEYQRRAARTDVDPDSDDPLVPLLGLGGEVGALIAEFKKKRRADGVDYTGFDEAVVTELGDILWYLAALARRTGVSLGDVAALNLTKTAARWLPPASPHPGFDDDFAEDQRLPRRFDVEFVLDRSGDEPRVQMRISGEDIGDAIDDNSSAADHYRFHDVFHLSYAAVLGWSPILRALLGRKRKADAQVDRVDDGARARAAEEAIALLVFKLAESYDYFKGYAHIDDSILTAVVAVASGLEVKNRTKAEWERAILAGFAVWRELRDHEQGLVHVDLNAGSLSFVS